MYQEGGSLMTPPEREGYGAGSLALKIGQQIGKALNKVTDPTVSLKMIKKGIT